MIDNEQYQELLDKYDFIHRYGEVVEGIVAGYENKGLIVDINSKSSAFCPSSEIILEEGKTLEETFETGKSYEFMINSEINDDESYYISHKKIAMLSVVEKIKEIQKNDEVVSGKIVNIVKGGAIVSVLNVKGFIPQSQMAQNEYNVGDELELKILSCELPKGDFILSNKKAVLENKQNVKKEILDTVELNMVVKGKVVRLTDFGAFVDIGGMDGLLPLSQISWRWIDSPSSILTLGETIEVEIIGIDKEKQRISLSLKSLEENPWLKATDEIKDGQIINGKVTNIRDFGAFIEVYPFVEGLLNKYQVKEYSKNNKPLKEGDSIEVKIEKFDPENQKITLEIV